MDHERAQTLIGDYLDGELDEATREAFEAHVAECDECRADLDALRATLDALAGMTPVEAPPDLLKGVAKKLATRDNSAFRLSFGLEKKIPFEAVSIILIGILLAFYVIFVVMPKEKPGADDMKRPRPARDAGRRPGSADAGTEAQPGMRRAAPPEATLPRNLSGVKPPRRPSGIKKP